MSLEDKIRNARKMAQDTSNSNDAFQLEKLGKVEAAWNHELLDSKSINCRFNYNKILDTYTLTISIFVDVERAGGITRLLPVKQVFFGFFSDKPIGDYAEVFLIKWNQRDEEYELLVRNELTMQVESSLSHKPGEGPFTWQSIKNIDDLISKMIENLAQMNLTRV